MYKPSGHGCQSFGYVLARTKRFFPHCLNEASAPI
jgi:hypothetical protein